MFGICFLLFFGGFPIIFIESIGGVFVEIGDYPNHVDFGINEKDCGVGLIPKIITFQSKKSCFLNPHPNTSYVFKYHRPTNDLFGEPSLRIAGGNQSKIGHSPWTVQLKVPIELKPRRPFEPIQIIEIRWCSGVLIAADWVLTSSDCMDFSSIPTLGTPLFGSIQVMAGHPHHKSKNFVVRPAGYRVFFFNATGTDLTQHSHDLALIKLKDTYPRLDISVVDWYYHINSICLPKHIPAKDDGRNTQIESVIASGWGELNGQGDIPEEPHIAAIKLLPSNECGHGFKLCSNMTGDDARMCKRDLGGPIIQYSSDPMPRAILVGILSHFVGDCGSQVTNATAVWVPIPNYMEWILKKIVAKNGANSNPLD